jgi:anti-anti-sigma regulatory factor
MATEDAGNLNKLSARLRLARDLDAAACADLRLRLDDVLDMRCAVLEVDASQVRSVDGSAVELLLRANAALRDAHSHLVVVHPSSAFLAATRELGVDELRLVHLAAGTAPVEPPASKG